MIIKKDKVYYLPEGQMQVQVSGAGAVVLHMSQDDLPFAEVKEISAGSAPALFDVFKSKVKFTSDDEVQISVLTRSQLMEVA